jgi:phosphoglucosamine mutase
VLGARARNILIAKDTRISGDWLESAFLSGALSAGADVRVCGVLPTPAVSLLCARYGCGYGVMISASHNPPAYNGLKVFDARGDKLSPAAEADLADAMHRPHADTVTAHGRLHRCEGQAADDYCARLVSSVPPMEGLRVLLDCAYGATAQVARRVFAACGCDVAVMAAAADGALINGGCGATRPQKACHRGQREGRLSLCFDGDGDRIVAAEDGTVYDGDALLYVLACDCARRGERGDVVATVMSNGGLARALAARGIGLQRTDVGDRHVALRLQEAGGLLGGENAGHIILPPYARTGDGVLVGLHLAAVLHREKTTLRALTVGYTPLPQRTASVRAPKTAVKTAQFMQILAATQAAHPTVRILVRPSGTEPVVRVLAEGEDAAESEAVADVLVKALREGNV